MAAGKITIRCHEDGWHVTRPSFGFGPAMTTVYPTGAAAIGSLTRQAVGSAGPTVERSINGYAHGLSAGWEPPRQFRPRWFEASEQVLGP